MSGTKLPSVKIEEMAANTLEMKLLRCARLKPFIAKNDKTPSWDGSIFVHSSSKITKDTLMGRIPIQVKGVQVFHDKGDTASFYVSKIDLLNYQRDGGVIFFVVHVGISSTRVFYKDMLSPDIEVELKKIKGMKSRKIDLNEMSNDCSEIEFIMDTFLLNRQNLSPVSTFFSGYRGGNEIIFNFAANPFEKEDWLFKYSHYAFMKDETLRVNIPIGKVSIDKISKGIMGDIKIDNVVFYKKYYHTTSKNSQSIELSKGISFDPKQQVIKFTSKGTLGEQLRDYYFLSTLKKRKHFCVDIGTEDIEIEVDGHDLPNFEKRGMFLKNLKELATYFGLCDGMHIEDFTDEDYRTYELLADVILFNKPRVVQTSGNGFLNIKLGSYNFSVLVYKHGNKVTKISNLYSNEVDLENISIRFEDGYECKNVSIYLVAKVGMMSESSNIDYERVKNSIISRLIDERVSTRVNELVLELIKMSDFNSEKERILTAAYEISTYLLQSNPEEKAYIINRFQIIKRMRELSEIEVLTLIDLKRNLDNNTPYRFAVNVLLESFQEANIAYLQLTKEEQQEMQQYPIFKLYKIV